MCLSGKISFKKCNIHKKRCLNVKKCRYVEFTVGCDGMNYLSVFMSCFNNPCRKLVCCDVISDDEIVNNYYYYTLDDLIRQIVIDWELE